MLKRPHDLLNLQNLVKRDPLSYADEFHQQYLHLQHLLHSLHSLPSSSASPSASLGLSNEAELLSLVHFVSHTASCFPSAARDLPHLLMSLLSHPDRALGLSARARLGLVRSVVLLQNRGLVSRLEVTPLLFSLFSLPDKRLRSLLFSHLVADIKRVNAKKRSVRLNSSLQNFIFDVLRRGGTERSGDPSSTPSSASPPLSLSGSSSARIDSSVGAKKSIELVVELWRRKVWTDDRTVNVVCSACFSPNIRITIIALRFFLGIHSRARTSKRGNNENQSDDSDAEEVKKNEVRKTLSKNQSLKGVTKRRKKRDREIARQVKKVNKERGEDGDKNPHFAPLDLIHDPQSFAERLFSRVRSASCSFPVRLLMLHVIARVISHHQLQLINYYSFLQRYLQPHQRHVTQLLTYLAQATHQMVPPDVIRPCVLTLAQHFVTDRSSSAVMQIGLNAIREICARQPLVMTRSLLLDLAQYKKHKVKGVMMAARSIIHVFREHAPTLLKRRERGKITSMSLKGQPGDESEMRDDQYAAQEPSLDVLGAELLAQANATDVPYDPSENDNTTCADPVMVRNMTLAAENDLDGSYDDQDEQVITLSEVDEILGQLESDSDGDDMNEESEDPLEEQSYESCTAALEQDGDLEAELDTELADDDVSESCSGQDDDQEYQEGEISSSVIEITKASTIGSGDSAIKESFESITPTMDVSLQIEQNNEKEFSALGSKRTRSSEHTSEKPAEDNEAASNHKRQKVMPYAATRIFTPQDFAKIKELRLKALAESSSKSSHKKSLKQNHVDLREQVKEVVDPESIIGYRAKVRMNKADRLAAVQEGRPLDRGQGSKKGGGTTNAEKLKTKPFLLVKHSQTVRAKQGKSFTQQQESTTQHIKNLKKAGNIKKAKRKMKAKRGY